MTPPSGSGGGGPIEGGRPAIFLDRDGTVIQEVDFLRHPDEVELIPGAATALAQLARAGFALVVVTNQSGVARGYLDEATLSEIHDRMVSLLAEEKVKIDLILYCPHHPDEGSAEYLKDCDCRKPRPGMLEEATRRLEIDLGASWTIGDSGRDLEAGRRLGVPGVLVATGKGASEHERLLEAGQAPEHYVPALPEAASRVLELRATQGK